MTIWSDRTGDRRVAGASGVVIALAVATVASACGSDYGTDRGYGYGCPPPMGYNKGVYRQIEVTSALKAGRELGTVQEPGCVGANAHGPRMLTLYAVDGLAPKQVVAVKDAATLLIYGNEQLDPDGLCHLSAALCASSAPSDERTPAG